MYKLTEGGVKDLDSGRDIPESPKNKYWKMYLEWVGAGNTPLPMDEVDPWEAVRFQRDQLLQSCDWVMCVDSPLNGDQAWLDYRQALRDIPQSFQNPEDVTWPEKP